VIVDKRGDGTVWRSFIGLGKEPWGPIFRWSNKDADPWCIEGCVRHCRGLLTVSDVSKEPKLLSWAESRVLVLEKQARECSSERWAM